ncbi:MAG: hypothetical protein AAAFM81_02180 [Pseudomonadota bacterium]
MKFYTQFQVAGDQFMESNLFSGIVELRAERARDVKAADLRHLLALNFDIDYEQLELVSWSRLH